MANSANPEINKKIATSALGTLFIATVFFYLGDRYAGTLVTYPGQIFDHLSDAFLMRSAARIVSFSVMPRIRAVRTGWISSRLLWIFTTSRFAAK